MRFVDEYRGGEDAGRLLDAIRSTVTKPWAIMEICGGQTHTLIKAGIDRMLPEEITLVHGPGCPVCVTPMGLIDQALAIARRPDVIFTSFGDMLRVPGSSADLLKVKSEGGGRAERSGVENFSVLCSHVLVPPAMEAILGAPDHRVQAFLAAGHVCAVMGYWEYEPIAERHRVPLIVTGFEPLDLIQGTYMAVKALEEGRYGVENQYSRSVTRDGNQAAQSLMAEVFKVVDREWRGIGVIPDSGYALREKFIAFDASQRFDVADIESHESEECIAGLIMQGLEKPSACPAFGTRCTPEKPLGAPMVSTEGACAAYYQYGRS